MIIQPALPSGYVIFCDDVRHEVSGKQTLVGTYGTEMTVYGTAPAVVPSLSAVVRFREDPANLPRPVRFEVLKISRDQKTTLAEATIDLPAANAELRFPEPLEDEARVFVEVGFIARISPLEISENCQIKVRAYVNGDEIRLGSLVVRLTPAPASEDAAIE